MSYELRCRMQKELDMVKSDMVRLENRLKYETGFDKFQVLKEEDRLIKRKVELEEALRIMGQFER
jgi:hypothetical protein